MAASTASRSASATLVRGAEIAVATERGPAGHVPRPANRPSCLILSPARRRAGRSLPYLTSHCRLLAACAVRLALAYALAGPAFALAQCPLPGAAETVRLARVIDGDTLEIESGERIRLIGVNTPELAHGARREEPGARAALRFTEALLQRGPLQLVTGAEPRDRYGRRLAYAFVGGHSVGEALVDAGMAMHVVIPPNVAHAACLAVAERRARDAGRGHWAGTVWAVRDAASLAAVAGGFMRVRGTVRTVRLTRANLWITLEHSVALKVPRADLRYFDVAALRELKGREVTVRGWLQRRKARGKAAAWTMTVGHPAAIEFPAGR